MSHAPANTSPSEGRALEVGCGLGHLLGWLVDRYQAYGTDINAWALAQAQRNVPAAHFALLSAEDLGGFQDGTFQVVIAKHVVEHLPHPERAVAEMSRILAPHGVLILATPNLDSYMRKVKKEKWIGYKDATHISLKPPAEWLEMLRLNGLSPRRVSQTAFGMHLTCLSSLPACRKPSSGRRGACRQSWDGV